MNEDRVYDLSNLLWFPKMPVACHISSDDLLAIEIYIGPLSAPAKAITQKLV